LSVAVVIAADFLVMRLLKDFHRPGTDVMIKKKKILPKKLLKKLAVFLLKTKLNNAKI
jgi:hypothetical protein